MKDIQGKLVILFIFGVALAAAVFAVGFKVLRDRRVIELWGVAAARLINAEADEVHLLVLDETFAEEDASDSVVIDDVPRTINRDVDITHAPGLIHARHSFVEDPSIAWKQQRGDCPPRWEYALRFRRGAKVATLLIDTNCQRARLLETGAEASIAPVFKGLTEFIEENLAAPAS